MERRTTRPDERLGRTADDLLGREREQHVVTPAFVDVHVPLQQTFLPESDVGQHLLR